MRATRPGPTSSRRATGRRVRDVPGAGAAGGVGFALLAIQDRFQSFALRPGIDLVMEATDFDAKLARADLVITGEGRIDAQTAFGKTALGVARRAQAAGVALHRGRRRRRARGHRGPCRRGRDRGAGRRSRHSRRGGDGRRRRPGRALRRAPGAGLVGRGGHAMTERAPGPGAEPAPKPRPSPSRARGSASSRIPRARTRSASSATGPAWSRSSSMPSRSATAASRGRAASTRRAS